MAFLQLAVICKQMKVKLNVRICVHCFLVFYEWARNLFMADDVFMHLRRIGCGLI